MFTHRITPAARRLTALLAVSLAATAAAPAVSGAAQNQGGGQDTTSVCDALLERVKRYNDIASDPRESRAVRHFYATRAASVVLRAKQLGCDWAPTVAITAGTGTKQADRAATSRRSAKRKAGGAGPRVPGVGAAVAAIKATTTGDQQQDDYCANVAKLIDEAWTEGDHQSGLGNQGEAEAWYDLAEDYIDRATANGCRFTFLLKVKRAQVPAAERVVATRS